MRYIYSLLQEFTEDKFVLISGPRQVGRTTLAVHWLQDKNGLYLNWDIPEDRAIILKQSFLRPLEKEAFIFDELHKYSRWKSLLKDLYDKYGKLIKVVVTGSARFDIFQRKGDSLFGRYEKLRLHPFSISEVEGRSVSSPPKNWLGFCPTQISYKLGTLAIF